MPNTFNLSPGDAIYARRGGNKTFAWYVVDKASVYGAIGSHDDATRGVLCHREGGTGKPRQMYIADIKHHHPGSFS